MGGYAGATCGHWQDLSDVPNTVLSARHTGVALELVGQTLLGGGRFCGWLL
jgi:hypothetical protein